MDIKSYFDTNFSLSDALLRKKYKEYNLIAKDFGILKPERDYDNPKGVYAVNRVGLSIYLSFANDKKAYLLKDLLKPGDYAIFKTGAVYDSTKKKFKHDIYLYGVILEAWLINPESHDLYFRSEKGGGMFYEFYLGGL